MSEPLVTDEDRKKARRVWDEACEANVTMTEAIAAALAAERAKARLPFLALAEEVEGRPVWAQFIYAEKIRRIAEES